MDILYLDNHLLVVNKPAGQLVQGDRTGRGTLLEDAREWLRREFDKPGRVFLGLVHRLDRPASGVVVLARTSKAAARLSEEFRSRRPRKTYWTLVEGEAPPHGEWTDRLERKGFSSNVVEPPRGKTARLSYRLLGCQEGISLVQVHLETGRHHQIRVQFSHHGLPVLGDRRYGSTRTFLPDAIALHARELVIGHPTRREELRFVADPGAAWLPYLGGSP